MYSDESDDVLLDSSYSLLPFTVLFENIFRYTALLAADRGRTPSGMHPASVPYDFTLVGNRFHYHVRVKVIPEKFSGGGSPECMGLPAG